MLHILCYVYATYMLPICYTYATYVTQVWQKLSEYRHSFHSVTINSRLF